MRPADTLRQVGLVDERQDLPRGTMGMRALRVPVVFVDSVPVVMCGVLVIDRQVGPE